MHSIRIEVVKAKCQSFRQCTAIAPELFGLDDDMKVELLEGGEVTAETAIQAARACPYRVISVFDRTTETQLFPIPRK